MVHLLDSHSSITCEGEILNADWGYYPHWALRPGRRLPEPLLWARAVRVRTEAYGAKILLYQVHRATDFFPRLHRHGWKTIAVTRRDVLRAAISHGIGLSTSSWHRHAGDPSPAHKISVDSGLILDQLARRSAWDRVEKDILSRVPHLALEYERDLRDEKSRESTLDRVLDYLELPRAQLTTDLLPTDTRPLPEIVRNLDEILAAVADSPWAESLDRFDESNQ